MAMNLLRKYDSHVYLKAQDSPHIWLATCWQTGLMLCQFWANLVCYVKWLITCWHLVYLVGPMKLGQRCANCMHYPIVKLQIWVRRIPIPVTACMTSLIHSTINMKKNFQCT
jgi:hypothetical protein